MKKNIIILFILISILGLPGCNEQLNTVPTGSVSELIFWKSENDALLAVNAAYRELDGNGIVYFVTATDLAMHAPSGPQTMYDIAVGTIDPTNYQVRDYWARYWTAIRKTNDPINN